MMMMGFSKKKTLQADYTNTTNVESESKKWVIAVRSLKPINTKGRRGRENEKEDEDEEGGCTCTTPTAIESRIPEKLPCPMAPRKRRPTKCNNNNFNNGVIEFFTPPDLETVFKLNVERESYLK